mgnify:CR=1 FL=1
MEDLFQKSNDLPTVTRSPVKPHLVASYQYLSPEGVRYEKQRFSDKSFQLAAAGRERRLEV